MQPDQIQNSPNRRPLPKFNTAIRLARGDASRLDAYIGRQRHPITRTVVIEEAVKTFLDRGDAMNAAAPVQGRQVPGKLKTAFRLPSELMTRLDGFVESQTHPTTRTLVIEEAIKAFLDREGA